MLAMLPSVASRSVSSSRRCSVAESRLNVHASIAQRSTWTSSVRIHGLTM